MMAEGEGAEDVGLAVAGDVPVARWIAGAEVVVATDEGDGELAVRFSPGGDGIHGVGESALARMEQVAEDDEVFGGGRVDEAGDALQVAGGGALGCGDAGGAEGGGLAEVRVGDEEGALRGVFDGAVGVEAEFGAGEDGAGGGGGARWGGLVGAGNHAEAIQKMKSEK